MKGQALNGSLSVPLARVPGSGVLDEDCASTLSPLSSIFFKLPCVRFLYPPVEAFAGG